MNTLFAQYPQLIPILAGTAFGFALGILVGWFVRGHFQESNTKKAVVLIVNAVIFILWTASVGLSIFSPDGGHSTPFILHAFMGAVIGTVNEGQFERIVRLFFRGNDK